MHELFNWQNWLALYNEDTFSLLLGVVVLVPGSLIAMLFSDNLQRWRANLQEQSKWLYWNRK